MLGVPGFTLGRWVAQGGFAGEGVVPSELQLERLGKEIARRRDQAEESGKKKIEVEQRKGELNTFLDSAFPPLPTAPV